MNSPSNTNKKRPPEGSLIKYKYTYSYPIKIHPTLALSRSG